MIAERNEDFLGLFEEGKEAEFFSSDDELVDKVRFYLKSPNLRKRIAAAGYERCIKSGYSNHDRVAWMLRRLESLRGVAKPHDCEIAHNNKERVSQVLK